MGICVKNVFTRMKIHACGIFVAIDGMKTLGIKGRVLKNIPITKKVTSTLRVLLRKI